jgi:hypothetical protein
VTPRGGRYRAGRLPPAPPAPPPSAVEEVRWLPGLGGHGPPEPPEPRVPWRRRGDSLGAAATVAALAAWAAVGMRYAPRLLLTALGWTGLDPLAFGLAVFVIFPVTALLALAAVVWCGVATVVTLPLAVAWLRTPERSAAAGAALLHAVVAWTALALWGPWDLLTLMPADPAP